jgi:flagellin
MGLNIVTNTMATEASNDISTNESNMQSSLEKLSSGYQINSPADDASGYVISQHLQAQIGGFQQAQANTQAGINVVQTADGALNEVSSILQRINTLAVQSANTSATDATAQQAAQSEVTQALESIANIAQTTVYGNNQLLVSGTSTTVNYTFQVGADNTSSSQVAFSVTALSLANLGLVTDSLSLGSGASSDGVGSVTAQGVTPGTSYSFNLSAQSTASFTTTAASGSFAAGTGAQTTFALTVNGGAQVLVTLAASTAYSMASIAFTVTSDLVAAGYAATAVNVSYNNSGGTFSITDAAGAGTVVVSGTSGNLTSLGLTAATYTGSDAGISVNGGATITVTPADNVSGSQVNIGVNGTTLALTLNGSVGAGSFLATANYNDYSDLNLATFSITGPNAIATINNAIQTVSSMGGTLGAAQNELTDISDNESVMVQNLQSSNAQIQDTDMASQMVMFTQDQTLVQAGVSMLAQANQIPQYVLKLLS